MSSNFGGTLAGGIQDISALLPLIDTEQSESHIGSALEGGFLYAAATPLSLFGSLGIVKAGISILVASIAIPKPSFSLRRWPIVSFKRSGKLLCGARVLSNAGFELVGAVAPSIGMDGKCYKAETRLQQILEEKHINDPQSIAVAWKSTKWNIGLVLCTIVAAGIAFVPYIQLTVTNPPDSPKLPWVPPSIAHHITHEKSDHLHGYAQSLLIDDLKQKNDEFIRLSIDHLKKKEDDDPEFVRLFVLYLKTKGYDALLHDLADSLPDTVKHEIEERWSDSCRSILPSMLEGSFKDADFIRLFSKYSKWKIFQLADFLQFLKDELHGMTQVPASILEQQESFQWNPTLPAEESLWSLEQYLSNGARVSNSRQFPLAMSVSSGSLSKEIGQDSQSHLSIAMAPLQFFNPPKILSKLYEIRKEHFPTPVRDRFLIIIAWIFLLLSLPAALAGYIGCFTLVNNSTTSNGPLLWLGLEAALSAVRVLLWASNPTFDEETEVTVELRLSSDKPLVTTEKDVGQLVIGYDDNGQLERPRSKDDPLATLPLVPESRFLERITSYTGPLEQFTSPDNIVLYFTLSGMERGLIHLFMVVFDVSRRTAFTLYQTQQSNPIKYFETSLTLDTDTGEMQATLHSNIDAQHPRRINYAAFFDRLSQYYSSVLHALSGVHRQPSPTPLTHGKTTAIPPVGQNHSAIARLSWTWSLSSKHTVSDESSGVVGSLSLSEDSQLYFERGYEHRAKLRLVEIWGEWITDAMEAMRLDGRMECLHALANANSEKGKWEHAELDLKATWEWIRRELTLLHFSVELEKILYSRMKTYFDSDSVGKFNEREKDWLSSEWTTGQRKRLNRERALAMKRMEEAGYTAAKQAKDEGRQFKFTEDEERALHPDNIWTRWEWGIELINNQWTTAIEKGVAKWDERTAFAQLDVLMSLDSRETHEDDNRLAFVQQLDPIFQRWRSQHDNERHEMDKTVKRIREAGSKAYRYPQSFRLAAAIYSGFSNIGSLPWPGQKEFAAQYSSGAVFDLHDCDPDIVREVTSKVSTRSVINVPEDLIQEILPNDHLFYVSSDRQEEEETPLAFVQRNRERWWAEQATNAWTFYLCPRQITNQYGHTRERGHGTIARVMLFIQTPTRLRLRLLHFRSSPQASVLIRKQDIELLNITEAIPPELRSQDFELEQFECGKHELELVANNREGLYCLSNIIVEFL